jgi:hypothetical protein
MGLGEVTVIPGSCVDWAASCDMALPHMPHNSEQLAALILKVRLLIDVIVPILKSLGRIRHRQRIRKRLPSMCDGPIDSSPPSESAAHHAAIPSGMINRCQEAGGARG